MKKLKLDMAESKFPQILVGCYQHSCKARSILMVTTTRVRIKRAGNKEDVRKTRSHLSSLWTSYSTRVLDKRNLIVLLFQTFFPITLIVIELHMRIQPLYFLVHIEKTKPFFSLMDTTTFERGFFVP